MIHEKTSCGEMARLSFTARDLVGWLQNFRANQRPVTKSAGQVRSKLLAGLEQSFRWRITSSICLWNSSVSTTQALKFYLLLSSHLLCQLQQVSHYLLLMSSYKTSRRSRPSEWKWWEVLLWERCSLSSSPTGLKWRVFKTLQIGKLPVSARLGENLWDWWDLKTERLKAQCRSNKQVFTQESGACVPSGTKSQLWLVLIYILKIKDVKYSIMS